jgi:hypothetical protein
MNCVAHRPDRAIPENENLLPLTTVPSKDIATSRANFRFLDRSHAARSNPQSGRSANF